MYANEAKRLIAATKPELIGKDYFVPDGVLTICEGAQNELFKLGYEWGQSRVIAGYHWQSDVDASRMLAAAAYARLHSCEAFLEDMAAARKEFKKLYAPKVAQ